MIRCFATVSAPVPVSCKLERTAEAIEGWQASHDECTDFCSTCLIFLSRRPHIVDFLVDLILLESNLYELWDVDTQCWVSVGDVGLFPQHFRELERAFLKESERLNHLGMSNNSSRVYASQFSLTIKTLRKAANRALKYKASKGNRRDKGRQQQLHLWAKVILRKLDQGLLSGEYENEDTVVHLKYVLLCLLLTFRACVSSRTQQSTCVNMQLW